MKKLNIVTPKVAMPDWLKKVFFTIQSWANSIDEITIDQLALFKGDIPPETIDWPEWSIPLALPADDAVTVDTAYVRCSGIFPWVPSAYPTGGTWYFEASLAIANAAATVTAHLMGGSEICVISRTGDTTMNVVRSSALTMPTAAANLYVEFKTSNASYAASFGGARLIYVP